MKSLPDQSDSAPIPPSPWRVRCIWCGRIYTGECPCAHDMKSLPDQSDSA